MTTFLIREFRIATVHIGHGSSVAYMTAPSASPGAGGRTYRPCPEAAAEAGPSHGRTPGEFAPGPPSRNLRNWRMAFVSACPIGSHREITVLRARLINSTSGYRTTRAALIPYSPSLRACAARPSSAAKYSLAEYGGTADIRDIR